jgi:predicted deacylase
MYEAERVTLARLPSGVAVETTVHTYGDGDGPTLYVQAAQHGREINGAEVCRRLHDRLDPDAVSGTLVVVPVADPLTFDHVSYVTPEEIDSVNSNMNRVWPGDAEGTLHQRMAAALWEYAEGADACVDLHTGSPDMLTHTVYLRGDPGSRALAEAFGVEVLLAEEAGEDADEEWASRSFDGKFRVAATQAGIPTITPELSHNRQLVEPAVAAGVDGVLDVCRHLGLLDGEPTPPAEFTVARNHLGRVVADDSGLFVPVEHLDIGREVTAGEHLGHVYDPGTYESRQDVTAERDGFVYSITREATVTGGETLVGVAERITDDAARS